jgi:hypothetical protein
MLHRGGVKVPNTSSGSGSSNSNSTVGRSLLNRPIASTTGTSINTNNDNNNNNNNNAQPPPPVSLESGTTCSINTVTSTSAGVKDQVSSSKSFFLSSTTNSTTDSKNTSRSGGVASNAASMMPTTTAVTATTTDQASLMTTNNTSGNNHRRSETDNIGRSNDAGGDDVGSMERDYINKAGPEKGTGITATSIESKSMTQVNSVQSNNTIGLVPTDSNDMVQRNSDTIQLTETTAGAGAAGEIDENEI